MRLYGEFVVSHALLASILLLMVLLKMQSALVCGAPSSEQHFGLDCGRHRRDIITNDRLRLF